MGALRSGAGSGRGAGGAGGSGRGTGAGRSTGAGNEDGSEWGGATGENSDASRSVTAESAASSGGLHDEGGSIRSQGGEPGLETGGPDVNGSGGGTGGTNGLRARWLKPHASQNIPDTGAPQPGQVEPRFAAPLSSP